MWIAGLKALISSGTGGRSKIDGWSDGGLYLDVIYIHCYLCLFDFYTLYAVLDYMNKYIVTELFSCS